MSDERGSQRITYGPHHSQFVDVYRPEGEPRGTILSIHGGYWRARFGLDLNEPMCTHLAGRGWRVVNIEYRRIEPGRPGVWPSMSADILAACSLVAETESRLTIALGHSAGGHLALWASVHVAVDAVVALAPVADLGLADEQGLSDHAVQELLGHPFDASHLADTQASPRHMLALGCPQLIVHGQADIDVPPAMSRSYAQAAAASGDAVELLEPHDVDHFDIIDPTHAVWRSIDDQLDRWLVESNAQ